MSSKLKLTLHAIVNVGANLLIIGVIPPEFKGWALMIFNIAQVVYAYYDPTYVFQQLGKKMGRVYTKEDLE